MSVDIFTVGGHSDAFGDVTVMDEEASSSVSSSLALSPWFSPENSGLLGDFGERWPISTFSMRFSETAGGWSNGLVFDIRDSPSWKISSKKQSWMSFSSYQDDSKYLGPRKWTLFKDSSTYSQSSKHNILFSLLFVQFAWLYLIFIYITSLKGSCKPVAAPNQLIYFINAFLSHYTYIKSQVKWIRLECVLKCAKSK